MPEERLVRGVGLPGAVAINIISMIGIGPLITVPLVLGALHGPLSLVGWVAGALLALCDGLVWAELGSLYPGSGGTYGFLRAAFGPTKLGRLLAFVFVWESLFVAPLNQATGYIGFANYAGYLFPAIGNAPLGLKALALAVGVATIVALYRGISIVSRISIVLAIASLATLGCVIAASFAHFSAAHALALPAGDSFWKGLRAGLGQALIIAMYDYAGYGQSSSVGGEVRDPARTLPRSIVISIVIVAVLYVAMQFGILGAVDWRTLVPSADGSLPPIAQHLASSIVERVFGGGAAIGVTLLVLVTAFASVYGNLLGSSRIPFAAAEDGDFLPWFAHLHPTGRFPDVALLTIGVLALPACLFPLDAIINALTTGQLLIGSVAQIVALAVVRARHVRAPYRMWLFPLPALIAFAGWAYIFVESSPAAIGYGLATLGAGLAVFLVWAGVTRRWPFAAAFPEVPPLR